MLENNCIVKVINYESKDDENGLYEHCTHFSTCATDIILKTMDK